LRTAGLKRGDHVFIRIFKEESELELWMAKDGRYVRFATYPICFWSGSLGPKLFEGDKQTPEGVYTVGRRQLGLIGRWPRSLNLWFPNAYDKANDRTGSYILIHGGCSSIGCYALTDDVLDEVHGLVSRAVRRGGQRLMHVHAFPFRMTEANLARHAGSKWTGFWRDLKVAYDIFNETKIPPQVGVCDTRYVFAKATFRQSSRMAIRRLRQRPAPIAARETEELQATGEPGSTTEASRDELLCIEPDVTAETEDVGVPREASFTLAPASRR
ncbi:MAG: murein L,D-transpeptidase family protein, partial [Pseudomonadota bacterium]